LGTCDALPPSITVPSSSLPNSEPPSGGEGSPGPPESTPLTTRRPWPCLDRIGLDRLALTQAIGGLALGLIALFSSYDHISFGGRTLHLQQQWGIPFIAASVAVVFIDAQLAVMIQGTPPTQV